MTMRITMLTTVMGEAGSLLTSGTTYTVSDAFGAAMVGGGKATDTDGALRSTGVGPAMFADSTGQALVRLDGQRSGMLAPVSVPRGFRWTTPPIDLRRLVNGDIVTDFDVTSYIPAPTVTYYVDPVNGLDANAGTSAGAPLLNLATALAKADVDQIQIINLTADYIALGAKGWNNTQPTRSVSVLNRTGYRYISVQCASLPTWAVNGTFSNVYETTIASASASNVTDLRASSVPTYVNAAGATVSASNVPARFRTLTKVASIAAVSAAAGTWYHDGTKLYVRAHDSRNLVGDTFMVPTTQTNNGRFPSVNNCNIYVENVDFVGGNRAFLMSMASTVTGTVLAMNKCSFQGAFSNGLAIAAFSSVYLYRCAAWDNFNDGFNHHSFESDGTTPGTSPNVIEVECAAAGNGATGSSGSSDNATTSHDFVNCIRVNGAYIDSHDRVVIESNSAHTWNLGCYFGQPNIAANQNFALGNSTRGWLDSCYAAPGVSDRWVAESTAVLRHYNSGAVVNVPAQTGTVSAYYG